MVFWGIFVRYNYVTHLIWEEFIVTAYIMSFILLTLLPKKRRNSWLFLLGFVLIITAALEHVHALFYPGYSTMDPSLAVLFWMYARGVFSFGVPVAYILGRKRPSPKTSLLFTLALFAIAFLTFLSPLFGAKHLFYHEGRTTYLKSLFEIIYATSMFIMSIAVVRNTGLFLALLLSGVGELWFISYGRDVFTYRFVHGHAFILAGAFTLVLWSMSEHVFKPYREAEKLAERYDTDIRELSSTVEQHRKELEIFRRALELFLSAKNLGEMKEAVKILREFAKPGRGKLVAIFYKNKALFKSNDKLPDKEFIYRDWEKFVEGGLVAYHKNLDERLRVRLKTLLGWMKVKINELELKEKLIKLSDELKRKDEFRRQFMRSISHELKTPLSIISGNVQLMYLGVYGSFEHLREPLEAIEEATNRARSLVESLLDYTKLESGRMVIKSELISFSDLGPLIFQYKQLASQKGLEFSFDLVGEEPFSSDFMVISTIISNLLSNAIKYTKGGYIRGFLDVRGDKLVIEVADSGIGIEESEIPLIFEPFYSSSEEKGLSGLGLPIVKKFVNMLHGKISVESKPGRGTKFRVEIPRLQRPAQYEVKEHRQVLLVEKDEKTRNLLKKLLKGYSIVEASCGAEGYLRALEHTPDLVVISIGLNDVSGEELVARLKRELSLKHTRYVLYTDAEPKEGTLIALQKGMDVRELARKLKILMGRRILLVYFPSVREELSIVKKAIENSLGGSVNIANLKTILEEEIGIHDSFIILSRFSEMKKVTQLMEKILGLKPPGTAAVLIFVEKGGEVSW